MKYGILFFMLLPSLIAQDDYLSYLQSIRKSLAPLTLATQLPEEMSVRAATSQLKKKYIDVLPGAGKVLASEQLVVQKSRFERLATIAMQYKKLIMQQEVAGQSAISGLASIAGAHYEIASKTAKSLSSIASVVGSIGEVS